MMIRRDSLTAVTSVGVLATLAGVISPSLAVAATHRAAAPVDHTSHFKPTYHPHNAPPSILVTSSADSGAGTLRAALQNAEAGDVIGFASTVTGVIQLQSTLYMDEPVYVEGPGASTLDINGGQHGSVFYDSSNGRSTITGLTISNGKASGGYRNGGGIYLERGSMTLYKDDITGNSATYYGGGIAASYRATGLDIYDSTISNNTATKSGGGVWAELAGDEMTVERSTISGNSSGNGGGLYIDSCPTNGRPTNPGVDPAVCEVPATYSSTKGEFGCTYGTYNTGAKTCSYEVYYQGPGNTDPSCYYGTLGGTTGAYTCTGAAKYVHYYCPTGSTQAGLYNCDVTPSGDSSYATIDNSTISGNSATTAGGGIFFRSIAGQGEVLRSTIANNTGDGIKDDSPAGSPILVADLITNAADCVQPATAPQLKDDGYNVVTDSSCALTAASSHGSTALSSDLAPLGNYGGPTQTIAVARTSTDPAFQTVPASATLPGSSTPICSGTDQRGVARSGSCDIGAFNSEPAPSVAAVLTSSIAKTKYGWYRSNVTVSFPCASGAPGIVSVTCPPAKVDSKQGKSVPVAGTAVAQDGATATATAKVNLDKTKPTVIGVKSGTTYKKAPKIKCHDSLSGVASCKVSKSKPSSKHVVKYSVTATDKAGNVRTVKGSYKLK